VAAMIERWRDEDEPRDHRRENPSSGAEVIEAAEPEPTFCETCSGWVPFDDTADCLRCRATYCKEHVHRCPDEPAS
jgi:hypothetical protein